MTIPKFKIYENIKSGYLTNHYVPYPLSASSKGVKVMALRGLRNEINTTTQTNKDSKI